MANDARIQIQIDSETGKATLVNLGNEFKKVAKKGETAFEKLDRGVNEVRRSMIPTMGIASQLGAVFGAWQMGRLAGDFVSTAVGMEKYETTLGTVLKSTEKAKGYMQWITDFAASTPFEIPGLVEASTRLEAYGMNAKKYMRTLGDTAGAMGKPIMAAVEMIADASQGEYERLKEFGFRATDVAKAAGFASVQMMNSTRENLTKGTEALMQMLEDRYAGGMAKLSGTVGGMWSNLKDQYTQFQMAVMNGGVFNYLKAGISVVLERIDKLKATGDMSTWAQKISDTATGGFSVLIRGAGLVGDAFHGWRIIWSGLEAGFAGVMAGITAGYQKVLGLSLKVAEFFIGWKSVYSGLQDAYNEVTASNTAWNQVMEDSAAKTETLASKSSYYTQAGELIGKIRTKMDEYKAATESTTTAVTALGAETVKTAQASTDAIDIHTKARKAYFKKAIDFEIKSEADAFADLEKMAKKSLDNRAKAREEWKRRTIAAEIKSEADAYADLEEAYGEHADNMETEAGTMAGNMAAKMGENLFSVITGEISSFKEVWDAAWKEMARLVIVDVAEEVAGGVSSMISSASSSLFSGLAGAAASALGSAASGAADAVAGFFGFDRGAWVVPEDMIARVHEGEAIIPAEIWSAILDSRRIGANAVPFAQGAGGGPSTGPGAYDFDPANVGQFSMEELGRLVSMGPAGYITDSMQRYVGPGNFAPASIVPERSWIGNLIEAVSTPFVGRAAPIAGLIADYLRNESLGLPARPHIQTWNRLNRYYDRDTGGSSGTGYGGGRGGEHETESDPSGGMGGVLHGGWTDGPLSGFKVEHHGRELTLNEDQVWAARQLGLRGGGSGPITLNLAIDVAGDEFFATVKDIAVAAADQVTRIKARRNMGTKPLSRRL